MSEGVIGPPGEIRIPAAQFFVFFGLLVFTDILRRTKRLSCNKGIKSYPLLIQWLGVRFIVIEKSTTNITVKKSWWITEAKNYWLVFECRSRSAARILFL